jgi:hypothetical protein
MPFFNNCESAQCGIAVDNGFSRTIFPCQALHLKTKSGGIPGRPEKNRVLRWYPNNQAIHAGTEEGYDHRKKTDAVKVRRIIRIPNKGLTAGRGPYN